MNSEIFYLDHAAATPVDDKVLAAMQPYFSQEFYNPSAAYLPAVKVRRDYEAAKDEIAQVLGCKSDEIVMTAGATESINLAFSAIGVANEAAEFIVGAFEHHSVIKAAEKNGVVKRISVDQKGMINLDELAAAITPHTRIVSVMLANNETGVIQPIAKISEIVKAERLRRQLAGEANPIYLHSDASQGVGQLDIRVSRLGLDMLTLNGGKIYAPKQTGLLWVSRDVRLDPQVVGGGQENNLRSGTENVPGVIGFAKALYLADKHRKGENMRLLDIKASFKELLRANFSETELIFLGDEKQQLNSHISLSFPGVDAERLVFGLESRGALVSTGSACAANKHTRSHTLVAMGLSDEVIDGSLRLSFGKLTTDKNWRQAAEIIIEVTKQEIDRLRTLNREQ